MGVPASIASVCFRSGQAQRPVCTTRRTFSVYPTKLRTVCSLRCMGDLPLLCVASQQDLTSKRLGEGAPRLLSSHSVSSSNGMPDPAEGSLASSGALPSAWRGGGANLRSGQLCPQSLEVFLRAEKSALPPLKELKFGKAFSDHMLEADWSEETGWSRPRIRPFGPLAIHPASSALHYGIQVFEGLKAFHVVDGSAAAPAKVAMFRPQLNVHRLRRSCERMGLPSFDEAGMLQLIQDLVSIDSDFVPAAEGYSLYIRPLVYSTQPTLGVQAPASAKLLVMCSPVGPYFAEGFKPVKVLADTHNIRAWPGGAGDIKSGWSEEKDEMEKTVCGKVWTSNYGPTVMPQRAASNKGYSQILWLFPASPQSFGETGNKENLQDYYVTEAGTMNVFVCWRTEDARDEVVTCPLTANIVLPGVTRDSIIHLGRTVCNLNVVEKHIRMKSDLLKALKEGRVTEIFGSGTACVVSPICGIGFEGTDYEVPLGPGNCGLERGIGPIAEILLNRLKDIQYGKNLGSSPPGWVVPVESRDSVLQRCRVTSHSAAMAAGYHAPISSLTDPWVVAESARMNVGSSVKSTVRTAKDAMAVAPAKSDESSLLEAGMPNRGKMSS